MAYKIIATEILKNPELCNYLQPEEIPLSQIQTQVLNSLQIGELENQGLSTLNDLHTYPEIQTLSTKTNIPLLTLQKITSAIDLLIRGSKHLDRKTHPTQLSYIRIVFFGLNSAGKTSIIKYIKKKEPLSALKEQLETRPTVGVDSSQRIRLHELPILLTELGGQKLFIETYVKDLESYFRDTHIAVFVIDSQDNERIEESLFYLKSVVDGLKKINLNVSLKIAIHKTDDGVMESSQIIGDIIGKAHEKIKMPVVELIASTFATTMYDPSSISNFFSALLEELLPIRSYVKSGLQTLNAVLPFEFSCLVDPELSRLPLSWVVSKPNLEPKAIINKLLIYTEELLFKKKLEKAQFTVNISNWIREMLFLPVIMLEKTYIFIYTFDDDYQADPELPQVEELVRRAIEPQLELAFLAIKTQN
ncbi:MAG: ADP-ribosylation factor-like protein [Candidatus Hodarchaeales archaeon]|jgi:signal recognition particle receptor subunit beta